jgi:hypothetical protein
MREKYVSYIVSLSVELFLSMVCRFANNLHIFFCMVCSSLRDCGELW